jgi:hypothetical protein
VEILDGTASERIRDKGGFVRPPTVDSCLAYVSVLGNTFHGQIGETTFPK